MKKIKKNVLHMSVTSKIKGKQVQRDTYLLPKGMPFLGEALCHFHVNDGLPMDDKTISELGATGKSVLQFKEDNSGLQLHYKLYKDSIFVDV